VGDPASGGSSFTEPPGEWFAKVFADTAKDGRHTRGTIPLLQIGMRPVSLTVSNNRSEPLRDVTQVMAKDIKVILKDRGLIVDLDFEENAQGDIAAFAQSVGIGKPKFIPDNPPAGAAPRKRTRWVWETPADMNEAERAALEERLNANLIGKSISIRPGERLTLFTVPTIEGGRGFGQLSAGRPGLIPR
jgi:hypothetical protein